MALSLLGEVQTGGERVKTEHDPTKVRFVGSPAPTSEAGTNAPVVYFDQWCWDHLVRERAGVPLLPA